MGRFIRWIEDLYRELRRRRVIRVAVVYATTAFVILQLGEILVEPFGLGDWALRLVLFLLVLGFPLAAGLAWVYNVTEEGVVREVREASSATSTPSASPLTSNGLVVGLMVVAIGLLLYPRVFPSGEDSGEQPPAVASTAQIDDRSIAVLPFENMGGEDSEQFTRGVHDDLLTRLSNVSALKVISRTSVEKYRDTELSLPAIADSLGAKWILEGGVQEADDQIQVNAHLIDSRSDTRRWADSYQRDLSAEGFFAIQGEIAGEIADALKAKLTPEEQRRIAGAPTEDLEAYRLYVQGRQALDRATSREDVLRAAKYFGRAIQSDSTFALVWAGLADSEVTEAPDSLVPDTLSVPEVRRKEAAQRALRLDPSLAEAHAAIGHIYYDQKNGPAALRYLRRAVELKPSYAEAQVNLGGLYVLLGRLDSGLDHLRVAEDLTPQHVGGRHWLGDALLQAGRYEEALEKTRRYQRLYPDRWAAHLQEVRILHNVGRQEDALRVARESLPSPKDSEEAIWEHAWLLSVRAAAGDTAQARKHFEQMQSGPITAYLRGRARADLGDREAAFDAFEEIEEMGVVETYELRYGHTKGLAALQGDPRYEELIRRINQQWGLTRDGSIPEDVDVPISSTDR